MEKRKEILLKALQSDDEAIRKASAEAMENLEIRERLPELEKIITGEAPRQDKLRALYSLSRLRGESVMRLAAKALSDSDEDVRATAVRVLAEIGDRRILPELVEMLKDTSDVVKRVTLDALSGFREPKLIGPLLYALKSQDTGVIERAIRLIARLGDKKAEQAMLYFSVKGSPQVKELAIRALGMMEG